MHWRSKKCISLRKEHFTMGETRTDTVQVSQAWCKSTTLPSPIRQNKQWHRLSWWRKSCLCQVTFPAVSQKIMTELMLQKTKSQWTCTLTLSTDGKGFQNKGDEVSYCRITLHALGILVLQCQQNTAICCNMLQHAWLLPKFPFVGLCFRNETRIITTTDELWCDIKCVMAWIYLITSYYLTL